MKTLTIVIEDHKTISWNKLYEQKHWSARKRLVDTIHKMVICHLPPDYEMFENKVDIFLIAYSSRPTDSDNVCAKLYIDGLKNRVIEDDDIRYVRDVKMRSVKDKENRLVIEITEVVD